MASLTRTANLLQEAIEGASGGRPRVQHLLPTVAALGSVSLACRPDPDFVAELGRRLQAEGAELAGAAGTAARVQTGVRARVRTARDSGPVIILVGHGLPRLLAGVAASLMAIGGVVGVASRAALPGQALYPVKQVLDTAAVSMAGTDLDKGSRLLSQAQEHIVEASRLVEAPDSTAADVNLALQGAIDDVSRAQALLQRSFAETHDPQARRVSGSFSTRAIPQVDALRDRVPSESLSLVTALRALLGTAASSADRQPTSCETCGAAGEVARRALGPDAAAGASPSALPNLTAPTTAGAPAAAAAVPGPADTAATPAAAAAAPPGPADTAPTPAGAAAPPRPADTAATPAAAAAPPRPADTAPTPAAAAAAPPGPADTAPTPAAAPAVSVAALHAPAPRAPAASGPAVTAGSGGGVTTAAGPLLPATTATAAGAAAGPLLPATTAAAAGAAARPLLPATSATAAPLPGVAAGVGLPSVNAGTSGVAVGGGGAGAGAGLPVAGATLGLPAGTAGTGRVTEGGGSRGATLPGVTITAPLPGVTLGTTGACVLGICPP